MKFKVLVSISLVFAILSVNSEVNASYDLPKIKIEKKADTEAKTEKSGYFKSDWIAAEEFEKKIKAILKESKSLPPSSKERIGNDKNLVFVAFYKDMAYFLDIYSIKIIKDNEKERIFEQHIFPVGSKVSSKNARVTVQKFRLEDRKIYNSSRRKNNLENVEDAEDKIFLEECFKVGYYYAFKEEVD